MANPSLKAKIEAAKSALESGQTGTPTDPELDNSTAPKANPQPPSENKPNNSSIVETPNNSELNAAALDARIISLEDKLAENQRDLYTLLGKIREVTRLRNETAGNTEPRNTSPKDPELGDKNITLQKGRRTAITLAVFAGIFIGAGFFLAAEFIDQLFVYGQIWLIQFVNFINDVIG